ncbi:MAG: glycosyltransferase [Croceibacterium sp.]
MTSCGFVFAMNRGRDGYQVPLALHEAGLLAIFVTDFYAPAGPLRKWLGPFGRRHHPGLAGARVRRAALSFLAQYGGQLLGFGAERFFPVSDRLLASKAARIARGLGAPLYAYSSYIPERAAAAPGQPLISFEYHPHPAYSLDILERDFARFPQVRESIEYERVDAARQLAGTSWREASHIVCASSTTLRSLAFVGCPPKRCTVIPYGVQIDRAPPLQAKGNARCQFLFVGQGIQRKGLHHLLHAWAEARLEDADLTLVCYRIDPGIEAMVVELQASGAAVRLISRQSADELAAHYRRSDVFAMPSLVEGFGLVFLEALAEGCHVLATHNTGVADLGLAARTATISDPGDIAALAENLRHCAALWRAGELDPAAIAADAARRGWADFRRDIAAHARAVLEHCQPPQGYEATSGFTASSS